MLIFHIYIYPYLILRLFSLVDIYQINEIPTLYGNWQIVDAYKLERGKWGFEEVYNQIVGQNLILNNSSILFDKDCLLHDNEFGCTFSESKDLVLEYDGILKKKESLIENTDLFNDIVFSFNNKKVKVYLSNLYCDGTSVKMRILKVNKNLILIEYMYMILVCEKRFPKIDG